MTWFPAGRGGRVTEGVSQGSLRQAWPEPEARHELSTVHPAVTGAVHLYDGSFGAWMLFFPVVVY